MRARFDMELDDPVLGRKLTHSYQHRVAAGRGITCLRTTRAAVIPGSSAHVRVPE